MLMQSSPWSAGSRHAAVWAMMALPVRLHAIAPPLQWSQRVSAVAMACFEAQQPVAMLVSTCTNTIRAGRQHNQAAACNQLSNRS